MRILAIEHDLTINARPDLQDILRAEAASLWDLHKRGVIREIWFTSSQRRAVVLLECPTLLDAREHLATLPLVRQRLSDFEVHELCPYDGYERLFAAGLAPAHRHEEPAEY